MRDEDKTKEDLINELASLRQHFAVLKAAVTIPRHAEESVITLEDRFRSIFENTIVGIYQSLPEGRYITVNSAFARIFGYDSPAELLSSVTNIGKILYVNTDDRDKCIEQVLKKGVGDFEIQVYRKDGCKAWVSNYVRVVRDVDGNIICFEGMAVDITQRKKAEEELDKYRDFLEDKVDQRTAELRIVLEQLQQEISERKLSEEAHRESEERYRAIFKNSPVGILEALPDGTILDANPAACSIFGYTKDELCAAGRTGLVDIACPIVRAAIKEGEQTGKIRKEIMHIRKDGTRFEADFISNRYMTRDGNIKSIVIIRDITKRKEEEKRLRQSEELFYNVFKASPAAMSINLISDYSFIDVNKRFTEITGYASEEAIGMTPAELGLLADKREISKILNSRKYGVVKNVEIILRRKTGEEMLVLFSAVLMNLKNETCILCMALDITELMHFKNEMARFDRLNLIGEMAAGIGHEVRNPMTTVRGFLQIFRGKKEFSRYSEQLDLMVEELDRANSIITEFLSLGKNRAIDLKKQNLNNIINSLYPLIRAGAMEKDKNASLELEDIPMLLLDGKEIRQVILNLVRNGLEATPPGGNITIRTFKEEGEVVLSVRDQGAGINSDVLEKIGTPFFTTKETGTGLGLAVCYSIAAKHNAAISIDTGIKGTTFNVRFKQTKNN
jgi:two-component system, sporulation sensor kinase E